MKNRFTRLTALLCAAAILLCSLPAQALAAEFQPQTAYEDTMPVEPSIQAEVSAAPEEPKAADSAEEPETISVERTVSVLSTGNISGDFTYSVLSDNTVQITGYSGTTSSLAIPSELEGHTVCSIASKAFYSKASLNTVTFPEGLTSIGVYAFYHCTGLKEINLPSTLTAIYGSAFYGCSALSEVGLPDSITTLGARAFAGCTSLTKVNYPKSWNYVSSDDGKNWSRNDNNSFSHYYSPFTGCAALKSIDVPEGVTQIPEFAFHYASIQSISLPDSLTSIESRAFFKCSSLEAVSIPDSVTSISVSAFSGCTALKRVSFPSALTAIYGSAFYGCSALSRVELPDSITTLGARAFAGCTSLTKVNYPKSWNYVSSDDGKNWSRNDNNSFSHYYSPFTGCAALKSIDVPDGVTRIPEFAFHYASIQSISLPDSLTSIESRAFFKCSSLEAVSIPDSVTSISVSAFSGCTALKRVSFPSALTAIYGSAFYGCSALSEVELPDSITTLGASAFANCTSLTKVNYPKSWKSVPSNDGGVWGREYSFTNNYHSPFIGCTKLTSLTVPEGVTAIPGDAFSEACIQTIFLPSSLQSIGIAAFYYCTALQSATVLSSSCRIADNAFSGCGRMTLYCPWVSNATLYAVNNGIMFQPLDASRVDYSGYLSDMSATALYTSAAAASVSSRIPVTLKYSIPQSVFEGLKKTQIVFTLSSCLELSSSIAVNGEITDAASRDGNTISIPINSNSGTIQLSVTPVQAGKAIVVASFSCTSGGSARTEIVGVLALDTPSIQLHEQSSVSTVTFDVSGICEKSKTLLLYIDDVQVGSVRAKKDGTFRTNVAFPNTPVSGTTYTLTAKYEDNTGITASIPVYYYEEAPNLTKFEMYYYGPTLKKLDLLNTDGTRLTNSIYPNHPFKFVVKFNHSEVLGRVCIASTKNGITKKMDAVFNEETDEYIAEGYFKNTDTSYIPGTINVYYTVKGDMSIHSRDLEQSELPDLWKNAAVDVMLDTGDTYCSQITLEDGQQLEFARNDSMTLEEVRDMLLPKASEQSRVQLNGTGVLDDPELEGVKSFVEDLEKTYGKNVISNAEKLATSDEEAVIAVKDNVGKRVVFVFWDSAKAAFRMASIKFLGTSFIQENSYGLSWTQSYQAYGIIADGGKNILQLTLDMVNLKRAKQDIEVSTTLTKEQKEYALEKLNGVCWGYAAVSLMRWAGTICNYAFTASGNPMLGVAVSFILNMAANLAENYLDDSLAYYAAGGRGSYLRWLIDPSGYVYDAETGERLAGVTVTAYWIEYDEEKGADESFWENTPANTTEGIKWDASEHSQQNSLITDESGCYAWEVPAGWWRVKYELAGYETAWSDWLPVPPPQLDVNIGLKPLAPEYTVRAETVTAERVSVRVTSSSEAKQTARCVLTAYEADGRLAATAVQMLLPDDSVEITLSGLPAGTIVKLFILNSMTGSPLRRSWSSALQAA